MWNLNESIWKPQSTPCTPRDLKLALGRQNGDIEIWNPTRGEWTQERILRGGASRTIDALQWTQDIILPEEDVENDVPASLLAPRADLELLVRVQFTYMYDTYLGT